MAPNSLTTADESLRYNWRPLSQYGTENVWFR